MRRQSNEKRSGSPPILEGLLLLVATGVTGWQGHLSAQAVGEVFRDCDVCPEMVVVPPGTFMMGSPDSEEGRASWEGPQHRVTIGYAFAVGVYEVTYEEWGECPYAGACDGFVPYDWVDEENGRRPVRGVGWDDAWAYADWLTDRTGEEYRLLSEAEWEYVARAGTETARYWGESAQQQCQYENGYDAFGLAEFGPSGNPIGCRDGHARTAPVGSYRPNAFGLYDVLGNVAEWVDDCFNDSYEGAPVDGSSRHTGDCTERMIRGGSNTGEPNRLRSAVRARSLGRYEGSYGFRVARTIN